MKLFALTNPNLRRNAWRAVLALCLSFYGIAVVVLTFIAFH